MRWLLFFVTMMLFAASFARGQDAPVLDQTEQIKALLARVELLEKQVAELKSSQLAPGATVLRAAATPVNPPSSAESLAGVSSSQTNEHKAQVTPEAAQQLETHYPSLEVHGFADVGFSATDQKGTNSGFNLGQFDLHIASALSRKISYFAEITVNAHPEDYTIEMERSFIRYDYNDYFKISFGRFHTPIGYWNTAFHHGAWLQTTIDRPFIVKVGGTFTPVHFVGALAEGSIPSGGLGLGYNVGVGNGRGSLIARPGDAGDVNNNRAWVAKVFARPARAYGMEVGGSFYRDKITLKTGPNYREWISSAYLTWTKGAPEFLAEFDNVNHRNLATNAVANSNAFYVQFGYRLPWFEKTLKPYYRFEYTHMPLSEEVFTYQPLQESIFGLRYDISSFAAFKSEYRYSASHSAQGGHLSIPAVNGVFLQTAFTF
jgi:Gram-negative porin